MVGALIWLNTKPWENNGFNSTYMVWEFGDRQMIREESSNNTNRDNKAWWLFKLHVDVVGKNDDKTWYYYYSDLGKRKFAIIALHWILMPLKEIHWHWQASYYIHIVTPVVAGCMYDVKNSYQMLALDNWRIGATGYDLIHDLWV